MHAVRGWSEALRHELAPFGVDVCVVEPGRLLAGREAPPVSARAIAEEPAAYRAIRESVARLVDRGGEDEEVGRLVAKVLRETSPAFRTTENPDASTLVALRTLLPDRVFASALKRWSGRAR
jgi:NAD(P)-dependent dehydrogenase (short-subunit alcohol dehydrogenase family)